MFSELQYLELRGRLLKSTCFVFNRLIQIQEKS